MRLILGILLGFIFALIYIKLGWKSSYALTYIKPFGNTFLNSLQAASIPLVVTSMVIAISGVDDTAKLSRISGKTFVLYGLTTLFSVSFGLVISYIVNPGKAFPESLRTDLMAKYNQLEESLFTRLIRIVMPNHKITNEMNEAVNKAQESSTFNNLVPDNIFKVLTDNSQLLSVVLITIVFSIALLRIASRKKRLVVLFCEAVNDAFLEIMKMIMSFAPFGVFALIASLLIELGNGSIENIFNYLYGLAWYAGTVFLSLCFMSFFIYPLLIFLFTNLGWRKFMEAMRPAQLVAFSTSSSSASLPVTVERVEQHLHVPEDISSFVLPIGATVNMNGTALYQGIAIVFLCQVYEKALNSQEILIIVFFVTVSAVGAAGVPSASLSSTIILLRILGIPPGYIALIVPPDRILDMCRTMTNITGDAAVAVLIASSEGWLGKKKVEIDDSLDD